jgi:signal transduction histidine kinase/DNA-binding response OmpR family regulator
MQSEKKVLLIDDEQIMHDLSYAYLERAGYQLISAYTGESGLRLLLSEKPDCVLLDYMMPGIDGEEVFSRIRESNAFNEVRHTPVIFLTARGGDESLKKRLIQKGVIAYLQKPFGLRELSNILDNVFIVNEIRKKNRELEREVKTTREYLDRVIQNAPVGIVTTNRRGDIIEANLKLQSFFLLHSNHDLKRRNVFQNDALKKSFLSEAILYVLESGKEWRRKFLKWQMPSGEHAILTARFVRLNPVDSHAEDGVIGIIEDVTERERHSYELHILGQIALAMQDAMDLDALVHMLLSAITAGQALGFSRAMLFLVDESRRTLCGKMGVASDKKENGRFVWADLIQERKQLETFLEEIRQSKKPARDDSFHRHVRTLSFSLNTDDALIHSIANKKAYRSRNGNSKIASQLSVIAENGLQEFLAVPLVSNDNLLGMIVVDYPPVNRKIKDSRLRLLTLFAGHAANALERASAYEQLAQEKAKLEDAYRDLKVTHERLVQSEKLAAIGEMAAHVAHEIRNPLVTIGGFAKQLVKKAQAANQENTAAKIIADEVIRLEKILANVLNFSRLPSPQLERNDMNQLIRSLKDQVQNEFAEKNIIVNLNLQAGLTRFYFDAQLMKQVLLNLLRNSQQSINAFGTINVSTQLSGNDVLITVHDSGAGIPRESIEKIFNPFYTTKKHGTGLGLAISRQIVHEHGGEIRVESDSSRGSIFSILLPVDNKPIESIQKGEYPLKEMIL